MIFMILGFILFAYLWYKAIHWYVRLIIYWFTPSNWAKHGGKYMRKKVGLEE
jgi:hypothetical protein